jgi:hypothetical protein
MLVMEEQSASEENLRVSIVADMAQVSCLNQKERGFEQQSIPTLSSSQATITSSITTKQCSIRSVLQQHVLGKSLSFHTHTVQAVIIAKRILTEDAVYMNTSRKRGYDATAECSKLCLTLRDIYYCDTVQLYISTVEAGHVHIGMYVDLKKVTLCIGQHNKKPYLKSQGANITQTGEIPAYRVVD